MKRMLIAGSVLLACGGQPKSMGVSQARLMDPATCAECHQTQYTEWSGSMHAYASDDPLFVALNQRGQNEAKIGSLCVNCHAPVAARTQATVDGTNLSQLPASLHGVTCYACHSIDQVTGSHNDELHSADDGSLRAEYEDPYPNSVHGSAYSAIHDRTQLQSSNLCGSCHDVVNGHGVAIERSFAEWQVSAFSSVNGSTCGQCHMAKADQRAPAADVPGAPIRDLHSHEFPGVDLALTDFPGADAQRAAVQSFLDTTLQTALCVRGKGQNASIVVIVDNVAAGHAFPSGAAQDRRAWFEVAAFAGDTQLLHSGQVPPGTDPTALNDDDRWLVRDCMLDAKGQPVSGLWNTASVDSNLLPAQITFDKTSPQYYQTHVTRTFPKNPLQSLAAFPDRVTLDVHLLPFPLDLFDDLFSDPKSLGLDADAVASMRAELTPLSIGQQLVWSADAVADTAHGGLTFVDDGVTMACVSSTGLNAAADTVPAPEHTNPACGL
jgi:Cytochrome c554 and c-prime